MCSMPAHLVITSTMLWLDLHTRLKVKGLKAWSSSCCCWAVDEKFKVTGGLSLTGTMGAQSLPPVLSVPGHKEYGLLRHVLQP